MKTFIPAVLALVVLSAGQAWADPSTVQVGEVRAVLAKEGVALRGEPKGLSRPTANLGYGTLVRVDRVQDYWMQVSVVQGGTGTGWLKRGDTIEPRLLSSNGPRVEGFGANGAQVSSRQLAAAGRQYEGAQQRVGNVRPDYATLDQLEAANRAVDAGRIESFAVQGRLGRR